MKQIREVFREDYHPEIIGSSEGFRLIGFSVKGRVLWGYTYDYDHEGD